MDVLVLSFGSPLAWVLCFDSLLGFLSFVFWFPLGPLAECIVLCLIGLLLFGRLGFLSRLATYLRLAELRIWAVLGFPVGFLWLARIDGPW